MDKIKFLVLYMTFFQTAFTQYIENRDFATRIYLMGNPSFILEDPENAPNLYALKGIQLI